MADTDPKYAEALKSGDLVTAGKIQLQYEARHQQVRSDTLSHYRAELRALASSCNERVQMGALAIRHEISAKQLARRRQISETFHQLQIQHVAALVEFEQDQLLKVAGERIRTARACTSLRDRAQAAAKDAERAQVLLAQADFNSRKILPHREALIKKRFLEGRAQLFQSQRQDMFLLTKSLKDELAILDQVGQAALDDLSKQCKRTFYLEYREFTKKIKSEVPDPRVRSECLSQCAQLYSVLYPDIGLQ
jgi:PIN domain nuclease of toxin-antitoxin system